MWVTDFLEEFAVYFQSLGGNHSRFFHAGVVYSDQEAFGTEALSDNPLPGQGTSHYGGYRTPGTVKVLQHDPDRSLLTGDLRIDLIISVPGSTPEGVIPEGQCSKARVGKGSHQAPQCLRSDVVRYCWRQGPEA